MLYIFLRGEKKLCEELMLHQSNKINQVLMALQFCVRAHIKEFFGAKPPTESQSHWFSKGLQLERFGSVVVLMESSHFFDTREIQHM